MRAIDERTLTEAQRRKIFEKHNYTCVYCYGKAEHIDHVIPWSYRHDDSEENLVAACWLCNLVAGSKCFTNWFKEKREYILSRRYEWIKRHPISLWLTSELNDIGYTLKDKVVNTSMVLDTEEERQRVRSRLLSDGFRVCGATNNVYSSSSGNKRPPKFKKPRRNTKSRTQNAPRPVALLSNSGEIVKVWNSITVAGTETGLGFRSIYSVCLGKRKQHEGKAFRFLSPIEVLILKYPVVSSIYFRKTEQ